MILRFFLLALTLSFPWRALAASEETLYLPQAAIPTPGLNLKQTANFEDLRHNILGLISTSKKRLWLMTDYLTDGDIVSALFLAKYRKVDVKVFLGQPRLNSYLSRLNYLKAQNIPVFTRPEHGFVAPTIIFVDQRLFTISRDLNVLVRQGPAQIVQAAPADVSAFVNWFKGVSDFPIPAEAKPMPSVGRGGSGGGRPQRSWQRGSGPAPAVSSYKGEGDGSYNYDRSGLSRRAEGLPTKLPKVLRWQKLKEQPEKERENTLGPEASMKPASDIPAAARIEVEPQMNPTNQPKLIEPESNSPFDAAVPNRPEKDSDTMNLPSEER